MKKGDIKKTNGFNRGNKSYIKRKRLIVSFSTAGRKCAERVCANSGKVVHT